MCSSDLSVILNHVEIALLGDLDEFETGLLRSESVQLIIKAREIADRRPILRRLSVQSDGDLQTPFKAFLKKVDESALEDGRRET